MPRGGKKALKQQLQEYNQTGSASAPAVGNMYEDNSPCKKWNCNKQILCASQQLACSSFARYIELGDAFNNAPPSIPTRTRFIQIYSNNSND